MATASRDQTELKSNQVVHSSRDGPHSALGVETGPQPSQSFVSQQAASDIPLNCHNFQAIRDGRTLAAQHTGSYVNQSSGSSTSSECVLESGTLDESSQSSRPQPNIDQSTRQVRLNLLTSYEENFSVSQSSARLYIGRCEQLPNYTSSSGRSSGSSFSHIEDELLVLHLPESIVKFIAENLECENRANWRNLVELHGWNFNQTDLFSQKKHLDGPFCSLLRTDGFSSYTLKNLKKDLMDMPKRDLLRDLEDKIKEHNLGASFR